MPQHTRSEHGFTLVELMITIAILAIVMSLAVPAFRNMIQENRATTAANELVSALALARSEAIARNRPITVCRRKANTAECESGTNWGTGWLVAQITGSGVSAVTTPIKLWDAPAGTATVTASVASIVFSSTGTLEPLGNARTICVSLPLTSGTTTRRVTVVPGGAHYAQRIACP